jgi:hypothetical protein
MLIKVLSLQIIVRRIILVFLKDDKLESLSLDRLLVETGEARAVEVCPITDR